MRRAGGGSVSRRRPCASSRADRSACCELRPCLLLHGRDRCWRACWHTHAQRLRSTIVGCQSLQDIRQPTMSTSTGGYPWASATCQTSPLTYNGVQYCRNDNWVYRGGLFDTWGYNYRNCTSWVAWRLATNNGYTMPHAIGDASAWGSYFTAHGHAPNRQPAPGAIAWEPGGDHVAYVESVSPDRSHVTIS